MNNGADRARFAGRVLGWVGFVSVIFMVIGMISRGLDLQHAERDYGWSSWTLLLAGCWFVVWAGGAGTVIVLVRRLLSVATSGVVEDYFFPAAIVGAIAGAGAACVSASDVDWCGSVTFGWLYFVVGATGMLLGQALINGFFWSFWTLRDDWEKKHQKK